MNFFNALKSFTFEILLNQKGSKSVRFWSGESSDYDTIIIELKSVRRIIKAHEVQLVNYLVAIGKPVGLILNFGEKKLKLNVKSRI